MNRYFFLYIKQFIGLIILVIIQSLLSVSIAYSLNSIIDLAQSSDINTFKMSIVVLIAISILNYLFSFFVGISQSNLIKKIMIRLKGNILTRIFYGKKVSKDNTDELLSNIINDIPILETSYFYSVFNLLSSLVNFILGIIALIYLNYIIGIIVIVLSVILQVVPKLVEKKLSYLKYIYSKSLGDLTGKLKEYLLGLKVIKDFNTEKSFLNNIKNHIEFQEIQKYRFNRFYIIINSMCSLLSFFIFIATICISSYLVIKKQITIGTMIGAIQLINNVTSPLQQITSSINNLNSSRSIAKKITSLLDQEFIVKQDDLEACSFEKISLENVSFSYDRKKKILDKINLIIQRGEKVLILGPNGSGKSTLLKLITSEVKADEGKVLLDDEDIGVTNRKNISKYIAKVDQDTFLFNTSIKNNISLYDESISEEDIKYWGEILNISGMIEKFGLETGTVGENGEKLSGGEKQQIAILRALVRNTPILIMDEMNSAIDNKLSCEIEKTLLSLKEMTMVSVTHKLNKNILKLYDKIIIIKDSKIIESGTFDSLMQKEGYLFNICNL